MRRLLVPVFAISLTVCGLAYAAGEPSSEEIPVSAFNEAPSAGELDTGDGAIQTQPQPGEDMESEKNGTDDPTASSTVTPTGRSTEGCPEGFTGNHGRYVSSAQEYPRRDAAHSSCGKPLRDGGGSSEDPRAVAAVAESHGLKKGHAQENGSGENDR